MKTVAIKEDIIRLDSFLKLTGLAFTGGMAKMIVQNGEVKVNNEICLMRTKKLKKGDFVEYNGQSFTVG